MRNPVALALVIPLALGCTARSAVKEHPPGMKQPPGIDPNTKNYRNERIRFGTMPWNGETKGKLKCGQNTYVEIRVVPEKDAEDADWRVAIENDGSDGYIVAELKNVDEVNCDDLALAPGETAYMWVGPLDAAGQERGVAFYKITPEGVTSGPYSKKLKARHCRDSFGWVKPKAKINPDHKADAGCTYIEGAAIGVDQSAQGAQQPRDTALAIPQFPGDGLWVSCTGGCCEVES